MPQKSIVTARSVTDNSQIFIKCKDVHEALQTAGKLHQIELKEHTYVQVRLRSSIPSKKLYKDLTHIFIGA